MDNLVKLMVALFIVAGVLFSISVGTYYYPTIEKEVTVKHILVNWNQFSISTTAGEFYSIDSDIWAKIEEGGTYTATISSPIGSPKKIIKVDICRAMAGQDMRGKPDIKEECV